jgi:hypothetical protein
MNVRAIACGLLLAAMGNQAGAGEKIAMTASPHVAYAPAHLTVRTTIEVDAANRALEIAIDSDDFYRSSLIQLDGDNAPRVSVVEFRSVPRGEYSLSARLFGEGGEARGMTRQTINVISSGIER